MVAIHRVVAVALMAGTADRWPASAAGALALALQSPSLMLRGQRGWLGGGPKPNLIAGQRRCPVIQPGGVLGALSGR
jgi:hypothetical protein